MDVVWRNCFLFGSGGRLSIFLPVVVGAADLVISFDSPLAVIASALIHFVFLAPACAAFSWLRICHGVA